MAKVTVRVSTFAEPIEVEEDEIVSLRQQGLLIEDPLADLQRRRDAAAAELERLDAELAAATATDTPAKAAKTSKES